MNFDIVCVGETRFEIFVSGSKLKPRRATGKDSFIFDIDATYPIDNSVYGSGGAGFNAATTFARQGLKVGCISRLGKDHLANQIKLIAKKENVDTELFVTSAQQRTDINIHIRTGRLKSTVLSYGAASLLLSPKDIKFPGLKTKMLYLAELPYSTKLLNFLIEWCKINKVPMVINITDLKNYSAKSILKLLKYFDRVLMTAEVAGELLKSSIADSEGAKRAFLKFKNLGLNSAVIYDVTRESHAMEDDHMYSTGVYKKVKPLDFTGANDVFSAGYISTYFEGGDAVEALSSASANACSVLGVIGVRSGILKKPALKPIKFRKVEL